MTTLVAPTSKLSRGFPGGFNPFTLSSIYSAWIAGKGVITPAAATGWYDPVGARHFGAIAGGGLTATFSGSGGSNSQPCLTFNGTTNVGYYGTGSIAQPSHIFVVGKYDADGSAGTLIDATSGNTARIFRTASTTLNYNAGGSTVVCAGCTPLSWHLHELFLSGASSFYKEDGTQKGSGNGGTASAGRFVIGNFGTTISDPAPVSISEVWTFSAQQSGANLTNFKRYITSKFGLTLV